MSRRTHKDHHSDPSNDPPDAAESTESEAPKAHSRATSHSRANHAADLEARITALEKELEESRNQNLRTLAEFQNFKRRSDEQRGEISQFANRELILGILPILDNFERALNAAEDSDSYDKLIGGVALTLRQLQDYLTKNGVEPIEAVGEEFDPNYHEAIGRVEDGDQPENTVVEEVQRGYRMHNRVLRPSMVKVAAHS